MIGANGDIGPIRGLTGAILAGGQARRMGGINKALLEIGGIPILDRILATLIARCERVIVIANQPEPYNERHLAVFPDLLPGMGSLGGLYTALEVASTEKVFVCACDMPFVNGNLLRYLSARSSGCSAIVPRDQYGLQPMHAIYSREPREMLRARLQKGLLKVEHFLDSISAQILPPEEVSRMDPFGTAFLNVNDPEDLRRAQEFIADEPMKRGTACVSG